MSTKLGAHVTGPNRNGYGPFCEAGPAMVLAVNEGGALVEARGKSGGVTTTIFRDTSIYKEFPPLAEWTENEAKLAAAYWWPAIRDKWAQNPADYYCMTNEQGGNDAHSYRVAIAYERRIMQLANAEGYKVCVLNLATGSPGSMTMWEGVCLPFIFEAHQAGNIYGRHAYGPNGLLVPLGGNTARPLVELAHLREFEGRLAITELGFDTGYGFVGIEHFIRQAIAYDNIAMSYPDMVGFALWELGNTEFEANWQDALPGITSYLHSVPAPAPLPPPIVEPEPPPPPPIGDPDFKSVLDRAVWNEHILRGIRFNPDAALQKVIRAGCRYGIPIREIAVQYAGKTYMAQTRQDLVTNELRLFYWTPEGGVVDGGPVMPPDLSGDE